MSTKISFPTVPFTVNVLVNNLSIRSEPSSNASIKGQTGKGIFTIVQVSNDWGKLKSGAGWIYLANTSYCTVKGATITNTPTPDNSTEVAKQLKTCLDDIQKLPSFNKLLSLL